MINTTLSQLRISQNLIPKQSFFDIFFFMKWHKHGVQIINKVWQITAKSTYSILNFIVLKFLTSSVSVSP